MRWRATVGRAALMTLWLAPAVAMSDQVVAFRGTGIRVDTRMFALGERRTAGERWQRLGGSSNVEYKTVSEHDGRVVALRCTAPCATESGVRVGDPISKARQVYGSQGEEGRIDSEASLLLFRGLGFEKGRGEVIKTIYVLPNT